MFVSFYGYRDASSTTSGLDLLEPELSRLLELLHSHPPKARSGLQPRSNRWYVFLYESPKERIHTVAGCVSPRKVTSLLLRRLTHCSALVSHLQLLGE
jgi:hypothetical protein